MALKIVVKSFMNRNYSGEWVAIPFGKPFPNVNVIIMEIFSKQYGKVKYSFEKFVPKHCIPTRIKSIISNNLLKYSGLYFDEELISAPVIYLLCIDFYCNHK